jgi:hypothetical protein
MAAQTVTLKLVLPYAFRPEEREAFKPKTPDQVARDVSEMFIVRAVTAAHGQEMDQKTARMFASIKRDLDAGGDSLTLNGNQWEWLAACFFGAKAEEAKVRPEHSVWFFLWLDALEEVREAQKAGSLT